MVNMGKLVSEYIEWCKEPCNESEVLDLKRIYGNQEFQNLYKYIVENSEAIEETLKILGSSLMEIDLAKACATAHFCGSLIETSGICNMGNDLVDLFEKVINLNSKLISEYPEIEDADLSTLAKQFPDEIKSYNGAELLTLAVMAAITRNAESRYYLRSKNLYQKMETLNPYIKSLIYVTFVHDACYDFKVLVLSPKTKKGFWMKAYDIHNCFYLITLLEAELYRKGWLNEYGVKNYTFDEDIYNVAIGKFYPQRLYTIRTHCSYYSYLAIESENIGEITNKLKVQSMIFGEMPPEYIPRVDGYPIIVMNEDGFSGNRSWDSNFAFKCHDALSPSIEILDKLTENEVEEWIEKILKNR